MELTTAEKIRVVLKRRGMTITDLANATGQSRQNLDQKLRRNNFTETELRRLCEAMNCSYTSAMVMNDTGETL